MSESTSLAGQMEAPLVIFNAQRPGPSTGLPTRTGQGDLRMAMHCGQGDFVRVVVAAGDHQDCVELAAEAFNWAEKYQIPVIFLTEKYIADQNRTCDYSIADAVEVNRGKIAEPQEGEEFLRYKESADGVSPRSFLGMKGGQHSATSYEHDERGKGIEDLSTVEMMMEKRWRKWEAMEAEVPAPKQYGKSKIKVFVWGGTKLPALKAQEILKENGHDVEIVQVQYFLPFKQAAFDAILNDADTYIIVEGNQSGQMESVIKEKCGRDPDHSIRDYYGRPMTGEWIADEIQKYLENK